MELTEYFNIEGPVEFVDVTIDGDKKLFLDPLLIARSAVSDPLARAADLNLRLFATKLSENIAADDPGHTARALQMMGNLKEPRETRLGMSEHGYNGRGVSDYYAQVVCRALQSDLKPLISLGVFQWFGVLPIYVQGIDADRMSDMTTGIVREQLIQFTEAMVRKYSAFSDHPHSLRPHKVKIWNASTNEWEDRFSNLPEAGGHPIILIPREWVGPRLEVRGRRFYRASLTYKQKEMFRANPKDGKATISDLEKLYPNTYAVNLEMTLRAYGNGIDLLEEFLESVNRRIDQRLKAADGIREAV